MSRIYNYKRKPRPSDISKEELRRQLQQAVINTSSPVEKKKKKRKSKVIDLGPT